MIIGEFNERGELVFEIGLVSADGESILVNAILDTGFTGWLALNTQEADSLDWLVREEREILSTAAGETPFYTYSAKAILDGEEFEITALAGDQIENILLGVLCLQTKRLVVGFPARVLTLG
jgi:predicted aspartyl protease